MKASDNFQTHAPVYYFYFLIFFLNFISDEGMILSDINTFMVIFWGITRLNLQGFILCLTNYILKRSQIYFHGLECIRI